MEAIEQKVTLFLSCYQRMGIPNGIRLVISSTCVSFHVTSNKTNVENCELQSKLTTIQLLYILSADLQNKLEK